MNALELERVSKNYGGLQVLMELSLTVAAGERVAVIGPNGAGKTTLLSVITGAQRVSSGQIRVFGRDVTRAPVHERTRYGLGCTFQLNRLFFNLTVLDNVQLALYGAGARSDRCNPRAEAQRLLEMVGLWDKRFEPAGVLSYGEQRQLEILLGLASQPKLLVMDEPTAGLALAEVGPFIATISRLCESAGMTLLFTSHDMDVVFGLADRVVTLYFGQIIAQGTPDEIRVNPKVREIYLGPEEAVVHA
jgi:branched-chain amino acid transport system ATP-binding protein